MTVLTLGTFDLFHVGHMRLLKAAARFGSVTVGVNSDEFVEQYKGKPPVQTESERCDAVAEFGFQAVVNDGPGIDLIREFKPRVLVVGSDWHENGYTAQIGSTAEELAWRGVTVAYAPHTEGVSTSDLRARL